MSIGAKTAQKESRTHLSKIFNSFQRICHNHIIVDEQDLKHNRVIENNNNRDFLLLT